MQNCNENNLPCTELAQKIPVKFTEQVQWNTAGYTIDWTEHVPPFRHGSESQESTATENMKIGPVILQTNACAI